MATKAKPQAKKKMGTTVKATATKKEAPAKNLSEYTKSLRKMTK